MFDNIQPCSSAWILISMDTATLKALYTRSPSRPPQIFCPLGNAPYLQSIGVPNPSIQILDWWDSKRLTIDDTLAVDITCTPCQHITGRSVTFRDQCKTLWGSWVVEEASPEGKESPSQPMKLFFGGDTAYRTVRKGENEDEVPVCPAFKQIGEVFGGFDVALLPIG